MKVRRRPLLLAVAGAAAGCSRSEAVPLTAASRAPAPPPVPSVDPSPPPPAPTEAAAPSETAPPASPPADAPPAVRFTSASGGATISLRILDWSFEGDAVPSPRCVVLVPAFGDAATRFPVVVALHGRGESFKGPEGGAWGWARDYALTRAYDRLRAPPLTARDFEGLVTPSDLAAKNRALAARPFAGVIVVCPYLPDLDMAKTADTRSFARFLLDTILPRVHEETPALRDPASTGIDGISLGGFTALAVGLAHPEAFGAVSGLQPALHATRTAEWVDLAVAARARRPDLSLRLLTSEEDVFRGPVTRASRALKDAGVVHDFSIVPGPHDYVFNRGPGAIELLMWHDRVLKRA